MKFMKKNGGFTLVELIVVIAILAILAGVAVPAYSGYVEKANKAADRQLLASVNTAFAAACAFNGESHIGRTDNPGITINSGAVAADALTTGSEKVNAYFATFFEGGQFKNTKSLKYASVEGCFIDPEMEGGVPVTIDGKTYYISQDSIDALKSSIYYEYMDDMQTQVNSLAMAYGQFLNGANEETLKDLFGEEYYEAIKAYTNDPAKLGNASVLYIAEVTKNMTPEQAFDSLASVHENLKPNGTMGDLLNALGESGQDPLPTIALAYGTLTAYANDPKNNAGDLKAQLEGVNNADTLLSVFNTAMNGDHANDIMNYVAKQDGVGGITDEFANDIGGYIGALDIVGSASGSLAEDDLNNSELWTGDKVTEVLNQIKG